MTNEPQSFEKIPSHITVYFAKKRNRPNGTHGEGIAVHGRKADIARNKGYDPKNLTSDQYDEVCGEWSGQNDRKLPATIEV